MNINRDDIMADIKRCLGAANDMENGQEANPVDAAWGYLLNEVGARYLAPALPSIQEAKKIFDSVIKKNPPI
jgi:hypothetical protein